MQPLLPATIRHQTARQVIDNHDLFFGDYIVLIALESVEGLKCQLHQTQTINLIGQTAAQLGRFDPAFAAFRELDVFVFLFVIGVFTRV